jgi:SEC-C motif-containing protein
MRSRYAAFALGMGAYLVQTLASEHEDLALPREPLLRSLSQAKNHPDGGTVLFYARIFVKGQDRSFAEHSRFVREPGGLRYLGGTMLDTARLPQDPASMTLATFEQLQTELR